MKHGSSHNSSQKQMPRTSERRMSERRMSEKQTSKKRTSKAIRVALCGCLLFASLSAASCSGTQKEAETSDNPPTVVSLGDSYSSGEGCDPYYKQDSDDKYSEEDWYSHRSTLSWPGRLVVNGTRLNTIKDDGWYFYASSGAESVHVYESEQTQEVQRSLFSDVTYEPVRVQLEAAQEALGDESPDYVTITIGGNDVGFTSIVASAARNNGFINRNYLKSTLNSAWESFYSTAQSNIEACYRAIREAFGDETTIIVAGYPTLLNDGKFLSSFDSDELGFDDWEAAVINREVLYFNEEIETLILNSGIENIYFVDVTDLFAGHEAYTDDPYLYGIMLRQSEDTRYWSTSDIMANVSKASMHPNSKDDGGTSVTSLSEVNSGVTAYAWAVQQKINELEEQKSSELNSAEDSVEEINESTASIEESTDTTSSRDIAVVLDVSGSMAGTAIEETKDAAEAFVDVAFENNAKVSLIAYDDDSQVLASLSDNRSYLQEAISSLYARGSTNMESGLADAVRELSLDSTAKKAIVLMSDGQPNVGLEGDELIAYAEYIRDPNGDGLDEVTIFTLGFNEDASGQSLLRAIASDGCFISVQDASDLEYFFADMADELNGTRFLYVRIACPVDVIVELDGEVLSSAGSDPNTRTSFGSLTFEEEETEDESTSDSDNTIKVLRLREGESYDIQIRGTGTGTMTYSLGIADEEGRYTDFRTFSNIAITGQTVAQSTAEVSDYTMLSIDSDGDGSYDEVYRASANSEGELIDNSQLVIATSAAFAVIAVAVVAIVSLRRIRIVRS